MSWVSKGLKFIRVNGRISPVTSKKIIAGSVFFCEIPVFHCTELSSEKEVNDLNHGVFAMACAQKWSSMKGVSFPCTFNRIVNLQHVELLDFLFREDQILAKTLATSLKAECKPPYMFTGLQLFERDDKNYNSSVVQISQGRTFLVALKDIPKDDVIVYTDKSEFNDQVVQEILMNTSMNSVQEVFKAENKCKLRVETVLKEAMGILDSIVLLPNPSQEELDVVLKRIEKFVAKNELGINKLTNEAKILTESAKLIVNEPVDFKKMEDEFDRLLEESGIDQEKINSSAL